ncbi:hypothetical protein T492DRAFT_835919 [Pavlovales sp. CCMP2436]|nr:hypothetical protein T492DRAFT_835919 [Pavlovales sp. CCMP2436]
MQSSSNDSHATIIDRTPERSSMRVVVVATPVGMKRLFSSFMPMSCMVDVAVMIVIEAVWLQIGPTGIVANWYGSRQGQRCSVKEDELVVVYITKAILKDMEKIQIPTQASTVTEEETDVKISSVQTPVQESTPPDVVPEPVVKPKRIQFEKQKLNYLKANARRLEILADAKATRVAAALEIKRNDDAILEYEMAIRLAAKYGFNTQTIPQVTNRPKEEEIKQAALPLRYQTQPPSRPPMQYV